MSEEEGQERTEQPTEKRLREAREQGQVARSREVSAAVGIGGSAVALLMMGGWLGERGIAWMRHALVFDSAVLRHEPLLERAARCALELLVAVSPLLAVGFALAIAAGLLSGGINFSVKALAPQFSRLNPAKGLARMYGSEALAELGKALLRVGVLGGFAYALLSARWDELTSLVALPPAQGAALGLNLLGQTLLVLGAGLAVIAAVDLPYQRWKHRQKLMMTREQVREELKESDGNPEVKAKIRRMQQQSSQRRMMEAVPTADVIVVNPTHYAVALRYDSKRMKAPRVVAKGGDLVAQTIREVAQKHGVPIVSAPSLARTLYRTVEIDREVPAVLYAAIALILTYVYQLRTWRGRGQPPVLPEIHVDEPAAPR